MAAVDQVRRVGFISTRIAGTDGVSLEIAKWATVLERLGIECYYIAGECDRPADRSYVIPQAHFSHREIQHVNDRSFETESRPPQLTDDIMRLSRGLRNELQTAIEEFQLRAIVVENALTIPMNLPLGVALVQIVQEMKIGCVAHHHDFRWERERFLINAVDDVLRYAFPPPLAQIQHVVINSVQAEEFSRRTGQSCRIIPNVMDFANPPEPPDEYAKSFRESIGLDPEDLLILQPTRVVARKGIEHAIELVNRMKHPNAKLVISHASGDEGDSYLKRIRDYAELMKVDLIFADEWVSEQRGESAEGRRLFTLPDVFSQCDLVTYPSEYEGFGNAFLEAIYHRCPIVCNRYTVFRTDIQPCGFETILFDGYVTDETVKHVYRVLEDSSYRSQMVERNYAIANEFFSFEVLESELDVMIRRPHNIYRLVGRGLHR